MEFLRFSIDENRDIPPHLDDMDWDGLLEFGNKQAIGGILYHGLSKLFDTKYKPDKFIVFTWLACYDKIKNDNKQVYKDAVRLTLQLLQDGYKGCVLKGQGNAMMYPDPYMRVPGDIDMWTMPTKSRLAAKGTIKNGIVDIIKYVLSRDPKAGIEYHHIDYNFCNTTAVEIHYFPSFMGNLFYEARLRHWFEINKRDQFARLVDVPDVENGKLCLPTDEFNVIFQLSHVMHHFFFEGVGLRQIIDYYYLLKRGFTSEQKERIVKTLKWLNMAKFASGMMWLLKEKLGLQDSYLYLKPNEEVGKLLYSEIIKSGNFGYFDERYDFSGMSVYKQYFYEIYRNLHYAKLFPSEVIWGRPISRWWHMIYKFWLRKKAIK